MAQEGSDKKMDSSDVRGVVERTTPNMAGSNRKP